MTKYPLFVLALLTLSPSFGESWQDWKVEFYQKAAVKGISAPLLSQFLERASLNEKVIGYDQSQAEFKKFIWEYLDSAVSDSRVSNGRSKYQQKKQFIATQTPFHSDGQILVAIWGMETSFGRNTGSSNLINALSTLSYEGRRRAFFEDELLTLLELIDRQDVSFDVKGSWAGGMGHTQFIPSSYQRYAVDVNGDGHRDLWNEEEALASTANYLIKRGWEVGLPWGYEVALPENFNYLLANNDEEKSIEDWQKSGVRLANGQALPASDADAKLFVPAGASGPKFLTTANFDVIKTYNNSDLYALSVALLGDRLANLSDGLIASWPNNAKRLKRDDIMKIQQILNQQGFDAGEVDGILGKGTRRAIQRYQSANGQVADGFLSQSLFEEIIHS